ncbi:hypothetical protein KJ819_01480 [Patescibacteria group bacterium]|nr:hypothetical protein [Patescibacteria group bacterium]MBU1501045.1 hypothetical protein [Patescibacteria group bacterium]MBU2081082.1 hypothetical protein [Patescibacteria group bacterium]MBU2124174.1 hypothetical protein [Patescibacteria group bacterium]MBU2195030.1 hypothetical protein [Patescibacteria group bacterium]
MQPIEPLVLPPFLSQIDPSKVVSILFVVLFIVWSIYTLITAYHWVRYGHRSSVAIPALITHVLMSGFLALYAVSGFTN